MKIEGVGSIFYDFCCELSNRHDKVVGPIMIDLEGSSHPIEVHFAIILEDGLVREDGIVPSWLSKALDDPSMPIDAIVKWKLKSSREISLKMSLPSQSGYSPVDLLGLTAVFIESHCDKYRV